MEISQTDMIGTRLIRRNTIETGQYGWWAIHRSDNSESHWVSYYHCGGCGQQIESDATVDSFLCPCGRKEWRPNS